MLVKAEIKSQSFFHQGTILTLSLLFLSISIYYAPGCANLLVKNTYWSCFQETF